MVVQFNPYVLTAGYSPLMLMIIMTADKPKRRCITLLVEHYERRGVYVCECTMGEIHRYNDEHKQIHTS